MKEEINAFIIIRGDNEGKVECAMHDLENYTHLQTIGGMNEIDPQYADNILVRILRLPLRSCCEAAGLIGVSNDGAEVIARVRKLHPPAHLVVVSNSEKKGHKVIFDELMSMYEETEPYNEEE